MGRVSVLAKPNIRLRDKLPFRILQEITQSIPTRTGERSVLPWLRCQVAHPGALQLQTILPSTQWAGRAISVRLPLKLESWVPEEISDVWFKEYEYML